MRQKKLWFAGVLFASLGLFSLEPTLLAQAPPDNAVKVGDRYYRKKTVISFGNDTIQGDLTRPDGEYIEARRLLKHTRLIKLRQHWKKKISQAVNDL